MDSYSSKGNAIAVDPKLQESIVARVGYHRRTGNAGESQRDVSFQHGAWLTLDAEHLYWELL